MELPALRDNIPAERPALVSDFWTSQRDGLGIPAELDGKPLLFLSVKRSAFDARFPGHVKAFQDACKGESKSSFERVSIIDLSATDGVSVVAALREYVGHIGAPNTDSRLIGRFEDGVDKSEPLPDYNVNVIYLPPLDERGMRTDGSVSGVTWSIDEDNYEYILARLANFLKKNDILRKDPVQISSRASVAQLTHQP